MVVTTSIPRFLLPQSGLIWRGLKGGAPKSSRITVRFSSAETKTGPRVLEKPERFNPPSHGARLPRKGTIPRHYGGDLSKEEVVAQARKEYPGMMAPQGTLAHRIIYSRWIHMTITLGTLTSLAVYVWVENFKRNSPFADMIPPASEFLYHPFASLRQFFEAIRLNTLRNSAITAARRARHVDDVEKRNLYRKAHGLSQEQGFASMLGLGNKKEEEVEPAEAEPTADAAPVPALEGIAAAPGPEETKQGPRKKFLGIF